MSFKVIDALIGILSGAVIALATHKLVPHDWSMLAGMLMGMVVGMVLHFIIMLFLLPFFGSFEVMIPLYIIGMLVGMNSGMIATMPGVSICWNTATGGVTGWIVTIVVQYSNKGLRGCR